MKSLLALLRAGALVLAAVHLHAATPAALAPSGPPPGVVVMASPDPQRIFVGSPTIAILADGTYVVAHDYGGPGAGAQRGETFVHVSHDRGATWSRVAELADQKWSTLFVHRAALYLIGVSAAEGNMIVRRSADGGRTWTKPVDAAHGLLATGHFHCGPTPVVVHDGRVWRAFEHFADAPPVRAFHAFVMSAPEGSDLLDAASWTRTNEIGFDKRWLDTRNAEWLEGNVVVAPDGGIVDILRVESHPAPGAAFALPGAAASIPRFEVAAMMTISPDGRAAHFDPTRDFIHFIGSESKFTIRWDPVSRRYWSLGNKITNPRSGVDWEHSPHHQRNVIALTASSNLRDWRERYRLLRYDPGAVVVKATSHVGFQYLDWQFDGDDLVAVCRMSWNGLNYHDANVITFHRVAGFRTLRMADSPPDLGARADARPFPGVVIDRSPLPATEFVGSPSIAILPDGRYVASHDFFGKAGPGLGHTRIFGSADRGATWTPLAELPHATWGALFVHRGALYLQAITHEYGDVVLCRSDDGGHTWTTPTDARHGVLFTGRFHSAPVPVIEHGGRVWRAVEEVVNDRLWPQHFASLAISAPADADLLDAANWTRTNGVGFERAWIPGRRPGWLEGNVVAAPDGSMVNLLRVNAEIDETSAFALPGGAAGIPRYEVAARIDLSADGRTARFDPAHGFFQLPGSQSKFTIRFDPQTQRYWSLVNKITLPHEDRNRRFDPAAQRNVVVLISSADLRHWREHGPILRWREGAKLDRTDKYAFQYLDWRFAGDDLVAVARTAWNAQSFHNANLLTFHRVKSFRTFTAADAPADLATP